MSSKFLKQPILSKIAARLSSNSKKFTPNVVLIPHKRPDCHELKLFSQSSRQKDHPLICVLASAHPSSEEKQLTESL